jgi:hypothetical protein
MTTSPQAGCLQTRADGQPCQGRPGPSGYCPLHDPALAGKRAAGRRKGGKVRSRPAAVLPDAADLPCGTVVEVVALVGRTINDVRQGRLDARIGNCIGVLAGVLLRALEGDDLARQLDEMQAEIERVRRHGTGHTQAPGGEAAGPAGGHDRGGEPGAGPAAGGPGADHGGRWDAAGPLAGPAAAHAAGEDVAPLFAPGWQEPGRGGRRPA